MVLKLVDDAILPMRLLDIIYETGGDRAAVDAVMREVPRGQFYTALRVLEYWGSDGVLDERESKTAIALIRAGDKESTSQCMRHLFNKLEHRGNRTERIDQVAGLIASGAFHYEDNKSLFGRLLGSLDDAEAPAVMMRWHAKVPGSADAQKRLVNDVLYSSFLSRSSKTDDLARCTTMADSVHTIFEQIPEASTYLCECLRQETLPARTRAATIELLFEYGDKECLNIKPENGPASSTTRSSLSTAARAPVRRSGRTLSHSRMRSSAASTSTSRSINRRPPPSSPRPSPAAA